MSGNVKKWFNRVGLGLIVVGIIGIKAAGGEVPANIITTVTALIGAAVILIREIIN